MKQFLVACKRFARVSARAVLAAVKAALAWLSVPVNACFAALAAAFLVSLLSWAIGDRYTEVALFFPYKRGGSPDGATLRAEMRDLPRPRGAETRAELVAAEVVLGPRDPSYDQAFPNDTRLVSTIYRKGRLYVDLSEDAAPGDPASLKMGLAAMRKSLGLALPGLTSLKVTIGGREPYLGYNELGNDSKKQKNN